MPHIAASTSTSMLTLPARAETATLTASLSGMSVPALASIAMRDTPASISPPVISSPAAFLSPAASPISLTSSIKKASASPFSDVTTASASTIASTAETSLYLRRGAACCVPLWQDRQLKEFFLTKSESILFCWSGGKDSAIALHTLLQQKQFRAIAACIDTKVLDPSFAGRELDESFFHDLPPHADPCGENGEFHTFVYDGPIFQSPIPVRTGDFVNRDGFVFCDLLPQMEEARK